MQTTATQPSQPPQIFAGDHCHDAALNYILAQLPDTINLSTPLGLGKPHDLLNAIYDKISTTPDRQLNIYTALSLDIPQGKSFFEKQLLTPFVKRIYGDDFPRLKYVQAIKQDTLPANIHVTEFFMQSGALLGASTAQSYYASINYTHIARALANRHIHVLFLKVAKGDDGRLSLSCNNDVTTDILNQIAELGLPRPLVVAEIDANLPYIGGSASMPLDFFDVIVEPSQSHQLFALPRQPVSLTDYAIGFYASTLIKDGGTLQIGIGALADAVCYALALRQQDNAKYKAILRAMNPAIFEADSDIAKLIANHGGLEPLDIGLYGASEILSEGFKLLVQQGVIKRKVVNDVELMKRINDNTATAADRERLSQDGQYLHGSFYLGSPDFYDWLRHLSADEKSSIGMEPISKINAINGHYYDLELVQRKNARFINTCMQATLLGGAMSETLDNGSVVAGVGGQFDFVSMAHLLPKARSMLLLRATREQAGKLTSNIRFEGGHLTIPRHMRDIFITEFGIADIRDNTDQDCITRMLSICHSTFQTALLEKATSLKKVKDASFAIKPDNTNEALNARLQPFYQDGSLPDYPLGSDFTPVEQRIVKALTWLRQKTDTKAEFATTVAQLAISDLKHRLADEEVDIDTEALARMGLDDPEGIEQTISAKLLSYALQQTQLTE